MSQPKGSIEYNVPNRGLVVVSLDRTSWPRKVDEIDYVPRWAIVPDPDQPRDKDDFEKTALIQLGQNIKLNGQSEVMKVRLLTKEEKEGEFLLKGGELAEYMIVSGGRRWASTGPEPDMADVPILKICVAEYDNEDDQFLDAFVINEDRENLGVLSVCRSLKRLLERNAKGNVAELCRITGKTRKTVDRYLRVEKNLIPEAKAFFSMTIEEPDRMSLDLGDFLAKLSQDEQRRWIQPLMVRDAGRTMGQKLRWLQDQLMREGGGTQHLGRRPEQPIEFRMRLELFIDQGRSHATKLLAGSDQVFASGFRTLDAVECANLLRQFETFEALSGAVKTRFKNATAGKRTFAERNQDLLPGWRIVDYYERGNGPLIRGASVNPDKYEELKRLGWLKEEPQEDTPPPVPSSTPAPVEAEKAQEPAQEIAKVPPPTRPAGKGVRTILSPPNTNGKTGTSDGINGMIRVSFYERTRPGAQEQLVQDRHVNVDTYRSLQRDRKLHRQQHNLPPSKTEREYCVQHGISISP